MAHSAAFHVFASAKKQLGTLNRVSGVIRLGVYVATTPEFMSIQRLLTRHRNCFEMFSATRPSLHALSSVSRAFPLVRRWNWRSSLK